MIPDFTLDQLDRLSLAGGRPLVICDVDEVIVHFTSAFESYLEERGLYLDASSFALSGNVRHAGTAVPVALEQLIRLIDDFFSACTEDLDAIDGAVDGLNLLSAGAEIVLLTNLPHHARDKRIANLRKHGLDFPCITNSGPKGRRLH
jgi:FMN phosphatase YigB (HAD superfamily)